MDNTLGMTLSKYETMTKKEKTLFIVKSKINYYLYEFIESLENDCASLSENIRFDIEVERYIDDISEEDIKEILYQQGVDFNIQTRFECGITTCEVEIFNTRLINRFLKVY